MKKISATILIASVAAFMFAAGPDVTLTVDTRNPGRTIPQDFSGFSFEAALLLPNETGQRYFRPDNRAVLNLFRTLGI